LANPISKKDELVRPGHIFPLIAKDGGVLERTGHTEGSVDLCKLAGLAGEAVICEIMKDDGTMARRDDLDIFAQKYNMKQVYISDLVEYRMAKESLVEELSSIKTTFFSTDTVKKIFKDHLNNKHTVIIFGKPSDISYVKFHNIKDDIELFLDDKKLNSLVKSIDFLQKNGGVLIFLESKLEQKETIKDYGIGAQILNQLNIKDIKLLSSKGKHSFIGINGFGLNIIEEVNIG
jgi:3,4-dihydroxy 2-butanone 4-phosphate synthase/GTP cyclohydrolase II